ncbi:hypothetical protein E2P81_ATG10235 [Venturia nashicola]|nr:hypothetical protein E2P81_ATG10235 [Venturia nashicola]
MTATAFELKPAARAALESNMLAGWTPVSYGGKWRRPCSIAERSSRSVHSSVTTAISSLWLESCIWATLNGIMRQADDDSSGEYPTTSANVLHKREFGHRTTVAIYYTSIRPLTQDPAQMRAM